MLNTHQLKQGRKKSEPEDFLNISGREAGGGRGRRDGLVVKRCSSRGAEFNLQLTIVCTSSSRRSNTFTQTYMQTYTNACTIKINKILKKEIEEKENSTSEILLKSKRIQAPETKESIKNKKTVVKDGLQIENAPISKIDMHIKSSNECPSRKIRNHILW